MLLTNLRFSLRYLARQRFFTGLHIIGLTLGISVTFVILLFIQHELSFDAWSAKADRTYRINSTWKVSNREFNIYATPLPLANVIRTDIPGIGKIAMVLPQFKSTVAITPDRVFSQEHIAIAEPDVIDIFDIDILHGDKQALHRPYHALISQSAAQKFFGNEDVTGKTFQYRHKYDIKIAGVFKDLPGNTSLPVSILISYVDDKDFTSNGDTWFFGGAAWTTLKAITYVVMDEHTDLSDVQSKLDVIADAYVNKFTKAENISGSFSLQRIADVHLDANRFGGGPWVSAIDSKWLLIFGAIGAAVLFLACVNFINLSTAQAMVRAKEAGIRKTIGAGRRQLTLQFLTEPMLLIFISGILAIVAAAFITDLTNLVLGKRIDFSTLGAPMSIAVVAIAFLLTGLAAGSYPAWLIARANPVTSLKPGVHVKGIASISWLRKTLVVLQFAISAVLMITVFTIARQAEFIHTRDLGFRKDGIIAIDLPDRSRTQSFVTKVKMIRGVVETSLSRATPLTNDHWWNTMGKTSDTEVESVCVINGDENFYKVYDLKLLSGRIPNLPETENEIHPVVVNERLLHVLDLGSPEEAIGKRFSWSGTAEITGVIADFHSETLHYGIVPVLIFQDPEVYSHISIVVDDIEDQSALNSIGSLWKSEFPSEPYEPKVVADEIHSYYKTESTTYTLFLAFAGIAVLISCLGLLGLCVFATTRRIKEISIRKVLGASVDSILLLLSGQFMKVVAIACVVALPIAWWSIDFLLGFYAYRINITFDLVLLPTVLLTVIAFATMLTQTVSASLTDPAKNLKNE